MQRAACNVQRATCNTSNCHSGVWSHRFVPQFLTAAARVQRSERRRRTCHGAHPSIRCKAVRSAPLVAAPVYVRATRRAYPCCRGRACARACMHACRCASALACAAGCAGMRLAAAMKRGSAGRTRSAALTPTACTTNRSCATALHSRVPCRAGCRVGHRVTWDTIPHGRVAWATSAKDGMSRTTMLHGIPLAQHRSRRPTSPEPLRTDVRQRDRTAVLWCMLQVARLRCKQQCQVAGVTLHVACAHSLAEHRLELGRPIVT